MLEGEAVTILHICAGWEKSNGAANIARMMMGEQEAAGHSVVRRTWASIKELRATDEVWIHCAWKPCLWWAAFWAKRYKWMPEASYDPVRLRYHGWKKKLAGFVERFFLRKAVCIVATCEAEKGWIEEYLGARCPRIEVTDIKRFFDLNPKGQGNQEKRDGGLFSSKERKVDEPLHLLYLGRRHPLKGLEYLEESIRNVKMGNCGNGQTGWGRIELRTVSSVFGEEKERVWAWSDVLVLPTLSENFGLVVAEALERGKRVITTDGAPAWGDGNTYGGRLAYLAGYREGTPEIRVRLLEEAIVKVMKSVE